MRFKAFLSYSHATDGKLAPALQSSLQRFGKAWYRPRAMRIFRDEAVLSASPALWSSIEHALLESEYFLLLASPTAARSAWIGREVETWMAQRGTRDLLIIITEGDVVWDQSLRDFDWARTNALPAQLRGQFAEEPLHVDLRWARGLDQLSIRHHQFRGALLDIAATLLARAKDELDSEDIRQHRRTMRVAWSAVVALCIMTLLSIGASWFAVGQRNEAIRARDMLLRMNLGMQEALQQSQAAYSQLSEIYKEKYEKARAESPSVRELR